MQKGTIDAVAELLGDQTEQKAVRKESRFGFRWLAQEIIKRQIYEKDMIIIVTGDRRMGKSTWALKLIRQYILLRRKAKNGFTWSWKTNFPISRTAAQTLASVIEMSFVFYDEGGDQFYRQETTKKAQRDLIKFMNKCGVKKNLTIINWPDVFTLDAKILNMAQLLVIVPYRAENICAWAFLYGRSNNPLNYDKFGIEKIRKKLLSPTKGHAKIHIPSMGGKTTVIKDGKEVEVLYPKELFKFLRAIPTFMKSHKFGPLEKEFEAKYIKKVKEPQLMAHGDDDYVNIVQYHKLELQYNTLLHNLYTRDDKSYAQIERLHISPNDGTHLKSTTAIKKAIDSVRGTL